MQMRVCVRAPGPVWTALRAYFASFFESLKTCGDLCWNLVAAGARNLVLGIHFGRLAASRQLA